MQNSNYYSYKSNYFNTKLYKNINSSLSYMVSILSIIAIIEFIRFCFDLYVYIH